MFDLALARSGGYLVSQINTTTKRQAVGEQNRGILRFVHRLFQKLPFPGKGNPSRNDVIENIEDGWMIVDTRDRIVDVNPAAERILDVTKKDVRGKPIADIMATWHIIINPTGEFRGLEMRRSVKGEQDWFYYDIRVSSLYDYSDQTLLGYLFTWRNITKHKLAENARQKAREEIFILLNGISGAASQAMSLDDFLLESINQIIYTFRSQAIGVFLINRDTTSEDRQMLALRAHIGLPAFSAKGMSIIPTSNELWQQIIKTNQHILIDDPRNEPLLPPQMREMDYSHILILPISLREENANRVLGCLFLATMESCNFTQDEITRLNIISAHIGQLIDNNQRRQTFIALSERQRLLRDLHDSVSQKLYGVVAMTEASQAMLEAGSRIDPSQVLTKIGESARQAVKEMRLFLHELQPVDLETEGLVSALNHRLAAVEGRADVKPMLVVDENILLSKEEETALYFIAQEALNNTLKHARAKSISLVLKRMRSTVVFEILDDGIGFDMSTLDNTGMGLRNMQERVAQINARLQIVSTPNKGTKITVKVFKPTTGGEKTRRGTTDGQSTGSAKFNQGKMFPDIQNQAKSSATKGKGRRSADH